MQYVLTRIPLALRKSSKSVTNGEELGPVEVRLGAQ